MNLLFSVFPQCKFIMIRRNKDDVIKSIKNIYRQNDWYGHDEFKLKQILAIKNEKLPKDAKEI